MSSTKQRSPKKRGAEKSFVEQFIAPEHRSAMREVAPAYYAFGETAAEQWHDIPDTKMQELVASIRKGNDWQEAIYRFTAENKWLKNVVLSQNRGLFLELLDFSKIHTALDLGSGWGQLTLPLARCCEHVVSVETTRERLDVTHAVAEQEELNNITFVHADAFDLPFSKGSFDLILLCGVYEWLGTGNRSEDVKTLQENVLRSAHQLLTPHGKIVIAIENRVGLKYLLGERDDHSKARHVSYLPYDEADAQFQYEQGEELRPRTYDQTEYRDSLERTGFDKVSFHLAFPDYKLPQLLVPANNEDMLRVFLQSANMPDEHDGTNGNRSLNNEILKRIYRSTANLDVAASLAPSFIIEAERAS